MLPLVVGVICGLINIAIAGSKGRSRVGWFFVGFLTGIIGLIICAVMSNLKEAEAQRQRMDNENRRLREQLLQEKMKGEVFRQHAAARLDAHDKHLGVDTRAVAVLSGPEEQNLLAGEAGDIPTAEPAVVDASAYAWYYEVNGETHGPMPEASLLSLFESAQLRPTTLVWRDGLAGWVSAESVLKLSRGVT